MPAGKELKNLRETWGCQQAKAAVIVVIFAAAVLALIILPECQFKVLLTAFVEMQATYYCYKNDSNNIRSTACEDK